jgi:hypothetical protein
MARTGTAGLTGVLLLMCAGGAARAEDEPRWAGSEVSLKHSVSLLTFDKSAEPDYNPLVLQSLSIDPTWRLSSRLRLTGHLGVEMELTDSDVNTHEREPLLEDTTVTAAYSFPALPAGLKGSVSLRLSLPTSKESIARERIAGFSPGATVRKELESGELKFAPFVTVRGTYNWQLEEQVVYEGPSITTCDSERGDSCEEFDHAGSRSSVAGLAQVLGLNVDWAKQNLSFTVQAWWVQSYLYEQAPAETGDGMEIPTGGTDWRFANVYLIAAEWQAIDRLKVSGGFQTENPQQKPDGSYYAPFFNRYTQLFLTATATF